MAYHVMVIDDEPVLRLTFKVALEAHGLKVTVAENGQMGLQACRDLLPDLVITDVYMPEFDGYAVIEHLRAEHPHLPVIAMSAVVGPSGRQRMVSLGAVCCITKPVEMDALLKMVDALLKKRGEA